MDAPSFDEQAPDYDARVGLGIPVCEAIAVHIASIVGGGRIVEWGCGTGEIGARLAAKMPYKGFDRSAAMLDVFRARRPDADLVCADGNDRWPLENGAVDAVFGSRSLHLMDPAHVAQECRRVASWVLVGRVQRDRESLRNRMRRRMQQLLRERGYEPRDGRSKQRALFQVLGVEPEETRVVAWPVSHAPADALGAWASKAGLAGILPDPGDKGEILATLGAEFGDPVARHASEEWYTVAAARLKGHP